VSGWRVGVWKHRIIGFKCITPLLRLRHSSTPIFLRSDEGTSRVFEALARAGDEKHTQFQPLVKKVESAVTVEMLVKEKRSTLEPYSTALSLKPTVPP